MKKNKWVPLLVIAALLSVNDAYCKKQIAANRCEKIYGIGGAANGRTV